MFRSVFCPLFLFVTLAFSAGCPESETDDSNGGKTGDGVRETQMNTGDDDDDETADAGTTAPPATGGDGGTEPTPSECGPQTPGYGEPCSSSPNGPLCGTFTCDFMTGELVCDDPGPNACGGCDELDTSAGDLNDPCGEHMCGTILCNEDLTATVCLNDHPRNLCGGCNLADFDTVENDEGQVTEVLGPAPGDACSECLTGTQTCSRDSEELFCWEGISENVSSSSNYQNLNCGRCERCVMYRAVMDQRLEGLYLRSGTELVIEHVRNSQRHLVFDPLVEGPGTNGLVMARIYLSTTPDFDISTYTYRTLTPAFAQSYNQTEMADPHRQYTVYSSIDLDRYKYVIIYDQFFESVISAGELVCEDDGYEPNDSVAEAQPLAEATGAYTFQPDDYPFGGACSTDSQCGSGGSCVDSVCVPYDNLAGGVICNGSTDYFSVPLEAGQTLSIDLVSQRTNSGSEDNASLSLVDENDVSVASASRSAYSFGYKHALSYTTSSAGTYYLKVTGQSGTRITYTINSAITGGNP